MSSVTFKITVREGITSVVVRFTVVEDENTSVSSSSSSVVHHTILEPSDIPSDAKKLSDAQGATVAFTASGLNTSTPTITITKLYFALASTPKVPQQFLAAEEWTRAEKGAVVCEGCAAPVNDWAEWVAHRSACHAIEKLMAMAVFREIEDIVEARDKEGKCPAYKQPKDTVADDEICDGLGELKDSEAQIKKVKNSRRHSVIKMLRRGSGIFSEATNRSD